jgi:hypothetical protein
MRVGVEDAVEHDLAQQAAQQRPGELAAVPTRHSPVPLIIVP